MLVLDDAGVRNLAFRVVDNCVALIVILFRKLFGFKPQGTVFERPEAIMIILVDHTGIEQSVPAVLFVCSPGHIGCLVFLKGNTGQNRNVFQQFLNNLRITTLGDSLKTVIKIVVIIGKPKWQAADNKRRKVFAVTSPLLLRIALDELFINVASRKLQRLLFQVLRRNPGKLSGLLCDDFLRLFRRLNIPHPAECVHIKRKVIEFIPINCNRRIDIVVEPGILVYIIPNFFIGSMKNMGTIPMYVDAHNLFRINIPGNMISLLHYQNLTSLFVHLMCKYSAEEPSSCNQIIIVHTLSPALSAIISLCIF